MAQIIRVAVPASFQPEPFPGSDEAIEEGCTCPDGQSAPGTLEFSTDCPIHELERVTQH
jgi:hypothetical protein